MSGGAGGALPAHAIVVLGGGVTTDGRPTRISETRVARAVELYKAGIAPRLILSGRCGLSESEPAVTEAAAMAAWARERGVPDDALLLEDVARDTLGNAYFVREQFLGPNGWTSVRVVTSDFHLSRAALVFRKVLGSRYDFSFVSAASGLSPRELIFQALEECRITIFLNEWLEAVEEGDDAAIEHLMSREHPGYAHAPLLSHEALRRRLDEIGNINRIAGSQRWIAEGDAAAPPRPERRRSPG